MITPLNDTSTSTSSGLGNLTSGSGDNQQIFLQLLVTQIQNQDPLNPQDPTEFVSQLNEFTATEQLLGIRQSIDEVRDLLTDQNGGEAGNSNAGGES